MLLFLLFLISILAGLARGSCDFYLAPSVMDGVGRGTVAGREYKVNEVVDTMVSVSLPYDWIAAGEWSLGNYVFASDEEGQSMAVFGIAMLMNHNNKESVHHYYDDYEPVKVNETIFAPSSVLSPVVYSTHKPVKAGEEFFLNYGGDQWFKDRNIPVLEGEEEGNEEDGDENEENKKPHTSGLPNEEKLISQERLEKEGFCLSDVYIAESNGTLSGYGVFARRYFKKGEIVTISPVLALPRVEVEEMEHESILQVRS